MVLQLARNALIAKVAWNFVQKKRAEASRARTVRRTWTWLALGAGAGAIYVAREPIANAVRGLVDRLRGEEEGEVLMPGGVLPLPVPPVSKKKQAREARREAAMKAERQNPTGPSVVHVERDADERLAAPILESVKDLKH